MLNINKKLTIDNSAIIAEFNALFNTITVKIDEK